MIIHAQSRILAGTLAALSLFGCGCSAQEAPDDPLNRYLDGRPDFRAPEPDPLPGEVLPAGDATPAAPAAPPPALAALPPARPSFEAYLGEHHYDVTKEILIPIKGGDVVYRFRRVDDATAYPPFTHYYEFVFHVQASGPGLLFLDEARFVAHSVHDGAALLPRRFRVGLADGSFRHFMTHDLDPETRILTTLDELTGIRSTAPLSTSDSVDPVTFFFNLFVQGVDMTEVESLAGHLLHPDETPIHVEIDREDGTAEVAFAAGEFLPQKRSRFRFFFDEKGRIDIDRFELEYGAWSMSMHRTSGPDLPSGD